MVSQGREMSTPTVDRPGQSCDCPQRTGMNRRGFLRGLVGAGLVSGITTGMVGPDLFTKMAFAANSAYTGDVMVVISLRGGFDGLSAVVPIADPGYAARRPTIAIPQGQLLPLDSLFGLHPAMAPLLPFWQRGTFGVVHAVGQADPTRSHFQAMEELEKAAPGTSIRTGWIDRMVGLRSPGSVFQTAQVGDGLPSVAFAGPNPELAMNGIDSFTLSGAWDETERLRWDAALRGMYSGAPAAMQAPVGTTLGALGTTSVLAAAGYTPGNGAVYDDSSDLAKALRDVARLIKANVGLQVVNVDYGDWDMHEALGAVDKGWMRDKLTELSAALAAFATDLGSALNGVTVVTLSEFGRRVEQNGSGGVDHGHGNAVMLLGGGVNGGRVFTSGGWPGLADAELVDGDLAGTTDYRQILSEVLQRRCGLSSVSSVFPGFSGPQLGVVTTKI
jgi:uncharacterized protein (DUF1501 family)